MTACSDLILATLCSPFKCQPPKMVNTLKQPTNCLSVFDYSVGLALKGLRAFDEIFFTEMQLYDVFAGIKGTLMQI